MYDYTAFGNQRISNSLIDNPFRYCGEYYDEESGLVYLRNRYYDSITGRFVTEDAYWNLSNMIYGEELGSKKIQNLSQVLQTNGIYGVEYDDSNVTMASSIKQQQMLKRLMGLSASEWCLSSLILDKIQSDCWNSIGVRLYNIEAIRQSSNLYIYCMSNPLQYVDPTGYGTCVTIYIDRLSPDSTLCEVRLHWPGGEMYSAWRFDSITVTDGDWFIFEDTYDTIPGTTKYPGAAQVGSVVLGYANVPLCDDTVRVKVNGLLGYNMQKGWESEIRLRTNVVKLD